MTPGVAVRWPDNVQTRPLGQNADLSSSALVANKSHALYILQLITCYSFEKNIEMLKVKKQTKNDYVKCKKDKVKVFLCVGMNLIKVTWQRNSDQCN